MVLVLSSVFAFAQDGSPTPPEIRSVGNNQVINCLSEPVTLALSIDGWQAGFQYAWSNGSTDSSITVKPLSTATYTVTVDHIDLGISETRSFQVNVNNEPISIENNAYLIDRFTCPGEDLEINVQAAGGHGELRYEWSFGATSPNPTVQPETSETYEVSVTDECGTEAMAQVDVTMEEHLPIEITNAITVDYSCDDKPQVLMPDLSTISGGVGYGYTFSFLGSAEGLPLEVVPSESKKDAFRVKVTDACGKQFAEQTIHLNKIELESKEAPTLYACSNEPFDLVTDQDGFYFWDGSAMHAAYEVNAKRSKSYELRYIDACGIEQSAQRMVEVERLNLDLQWNVEHLDHSIFAFARSAEGLSNYQWRLNGELISTEDQVELLDLEAEENELTFEATSDLGCRYEARRTVVFQDGVQIPSAISPNGDGLNERFRVSFEEELQAFQITIFDRWGQQVFRSLDQHFEWSPSNAQVIGPIGTFAYVLEAQTKGGKTIEKTGVLTTIHAK